MTDDPGSADDAPPADDRLDALREPWRLRDHIGVVSGVLLGLLALLVLILLAVAGDSGALAILVVIVIGIALIFFGGQLHGDRGRGRRAP